MKKCLTAVAIMFFLVPVSSPVNAQGFQSIANPWSLPSGGNKTGTHMYGFHATGYVGSAGSGDQGWTLCDMDGDGKRDLVVFAQGTGSFKESFNLTLNPHWQVYINNGTAFSTLPIQWKLPTGGSVVQGHASGFNDFSNNGSFSTGDQGWAVADMNGDMKPDLVVVCQGTGSFRDCFGLPSSPHWKVYLNNGTAFSTSATQWTLPSGGSDENSHVFGFDGFSSDGSYMNNDQGWTVMEMNGDGKPDLVVISQGDGTTSDCFGAGSANQYWKVFFNSGSGFATSPATWALPAGGKNFNQHDYGFNMTASFGTYQTGDMAWALMDMNNDTKLDLVVTAEGNGNFRDCYGVGTAPFWKVFLSSGTGYATSHMSWSVPPGGTNINSHLFGFYCTANPGSSTLNDQGYAVMEINGDAKPEMVVFSQGDGTFQDCFGTSKNSWKVYEGTTTGFSTTATTWTLPAGGSKMSGHSFGFLINTYSGSYEAGNQGWDVTDLDGDGAADLVVTCEGNGTYRDNYGVGTDPHWNVYSVPTKTVDNTAITENHFSAIEIFPNPAEDQLIITTPDVGSHYFIYNVSGMKIQDGVIESSNNAVDISKLSQGMYFIQLLGARPSAAAKLIKQ